MATDQDPPKFSRSNQSAENGVPGQPGSAVDPDEIAQKVNLNLSPSLDALRQTASKPQDPAHMVTPDTDTDTDIDTDTKDTTARSEFNFGRDPDWTQPVVGSAKRENPFYKLMLLGTLALTLTGGVFLWQITLRIQTIEDSLPGGENALAFNSPHAAVSKSTDSESSFKNASRIEALEQQIRELEQSIQATMRVEKTQPSARPAEAELERNLEFILARLSQLETTVTTKKSEKIKPATTRAEAKQTETLTASMAPTAAYPSASSQLVEIQSSNNQSSNKDNAVAKAKLWFVNLGTFSERSSAESLKQRAAAIYAKVELVTVQANQLSLYRVRASGFPSQQAAELKAQQLQAALELGGVWVAEQDN